MGHSNLPLPKSVIDYEETTALDRPGQPGSVLIYLRRSRTGVRRGVSTEDIGLAAAAAVEWQHHGSPAEPCARPGEACSCGSLAAAALAPGEANEEAGMATEGFSPLACLILAAAPPSAQHHGLGPRRLRNFP